MNWLRRLLDRFRFPVPDDHPLELERCEGCNALTDEPHTITESTDLGDGTGFDLSAIFCPECCPLAVHVGHEGTEHRTGVSAQ